MLECFGLLYPIVTLLAVPSLAASLLRPIYLLPFIMMYIGQVSKELRSVLTSSQGRCPWRGRHHRRGWPSSGSQDGPSCSPCHATSAPAGGSRACGLCEYHVACLRGITKGQVVSGVKTIISKWSTLTFVAILVIN